jgi:hypothetical protein
MKLSCPNTSTNASSGNCDHHEGPLVSHGGQGRRALPRSRAEDRTLGLAERAVETVVPVVLTEHFAQQELCATSRSYALERGRIVQQGTSSSQL